DFQTGRPYNDNRRAQENLGAVAIKQRLNPNLGVESVAIKSTITQGPTRLHWTVWRFESPSSGEVKIVARRSEQLDATYQHAYQRILWQGAAWTAKEALDYAAANKGETAVDSPR